jgi:hypothetical protein
VLYDLRGLYALRMAEDFSFVPNQIASFGRFMDESLGQTSVPQAKRYVDAHLTPVGDRTGLFGTFAATADLQQDSSERYTLSILSNRWDQLLARTILLSFRV